MQSEGAVLHGGGEHRGLPGAKCQPCAHMRCCSKERYGENVNVELCFNQKLFLQGLLESNYMGFVKWLH